MYSLARLTMQRGARVSGSDREASEHTRLLSLLGAEITISHSSEAVEGADLVVYTHAIGEDNPELCEARSRGIPTLSRAEYMAAQGSKYTEILNWYYKDCTLVKVK